MNNTAQSPTLSSSEIVSRWYPLIISRFVMCLELPMAAYAMANLPEPELNLSAFGALLIATCYFFQSAVWNLLGTSAALVKGKADLKILVRFLNYMCLVIALAYLVLVISPLAKYILVPLFGSTEALFNLALPSFILGASWPFLVGYRRINQGVLIHVGRSKLVSLISVTRIVSLALLLTTMLIVRPPFSGITIVSICTTLAVLMETLTSHILVVKYGVPRLSDEASDLTVRSAWIFCLPMIAASIISQIMLPLGSATLFRLPNSQLSLVVWPAIAGFLQMVRTVGFSLIELTASFGDNAENRATILTFANRVSLLLMFFLTVFVLTGAGENYFTSVGGLDADYAKFAAATLLFGLLYPVIETRLWYLSGAAYAMKETGVTAEATIVAVALGFALYFVGVHQTQFSGASFLLMVFTVCTAAEIAVFTFQLNRRSAARAVS